MRMLVVRGCFHKHGFQTKHSAKQSLIMECLDGQLSVKPLSLPAVINSFSFGTKPGKFGCALPLYLAEFQWDSFLKAALFPSLKLC